MTFKYQLNNLNTVIQNFKKRDFSGAKVKLKTANSFQWLKQWSPLLTFNLLLSKLTPKSAGKKKREGERKREM